MANNIPEGRHWILAQNMGLPCLKQQKSPIFSAGVIGKHEKTTLDRKQSLTCHKKGEISHGIFHHPQLVRDETTLRAGLPCGRIQWKTKGHNKGARSPSENVEYLCK